MCAAEVEEISILVPGGHHGWAYFEEIDANNIPHPPTRITRCSGFDAQGTRDWFESRVLTAPVVLIPIVVMTLLALLIRTPNQGGKTQGSPRHIQDMTEMRTERDTMGDIQVPSDRYYGAQTARSLENFDIGQDLMPTRVIRSIWDPQAGRRANESGLGDLPDDVANLIIAASQEVIDGELDDHFRSESGKRGRAHRPT